MSESTARPTASDPADFDRGAFRAGGGERLLVWAMRKYAFRCTTACLVQHAFREACGGSDGGAACAAFRQMLLLLAGNARRPLAFGPPGWPGATPDENRLLQLLAAAQARSEDHMRMQLAWLVPAEAARQVQPFVEFVATTLRDHHCVLSLARPCADGAQAGPGRLERDDAGGFDRVSGLTDRHDRLLFANANCSYSLPHYSGI